MTVPAIGPSDGSDASDESAGEPQRHVAAGPASWVPPSGHDIAGYSGWESWSRRRWAWEFLRRNSQFQEACRERRDDLLTIAADYRLREFKDYREDYRMNARPKFGGVRSFPSEAEFVERNRTGVDPAAFETRTDLFPSEVLIRFQIAPLLGAEKTGIDAQFELARKRLARFAKDLRSLLASKGKGKSRYVWEFDRARLVAALQILDRSTNTTRKLNLKVAAEELLPDPFAAKNKQSTIKKLSGKGATLLEQAMRFAHGGYLQVRWGKLQAGK